MSWVSWLPQGECIRTSRRLPSGEWSTPIACTPFRSQITGLAMTSWERGVLLSWIDGKDSERDGLKLVEVDEDGPVGEPVLIVPYRRGPAHVAIDSFGPKFGLSWSVRRVGGRHVFGCVAEHPEQQLRIVQLSKEHTDFNIRPSVTMLEDRCCFVWETNTKGMFQILARFLHPGGDTPPVKICDDVVGICSRPATCRSDKGVWIGWQSDRDPESGPGLVRWVEVAHLSPEGELRRPSAKMVGVNRNGEGEDQGFESPHLSTAADGQLVVVGRGSQSVKMEVLSGNGWSDLEQVDEEGWQCRGQRFCGCPTAGGVLIVGREKQGITVRFAEIEKISSPQPIGLEPSQFVLDHDSVVEERQRHIIAGYPVLFGDIHQHTAASDGTGTAEEAICRARFRYRDDVVAISEHESFVGKRTAPGDWAELTRITDEYYHPGTFVTLYAFEWTGKMHPGPGHKVVYLPPGGGPVLSREDPQTSTAKGLIAESRRQGAFVVPHHVGWTGANMEDHDPGVQVCWEVVSCHGVYERMGKGPIGTRGDDKQGQFIGDALDAGLRFGFVGGSDGHGLNWHHGVCRVKDSHRAGLTGFLSKEASRESVLGALKRRRCYATSGAKIGLYFEVDGRPMGEELIIGTPVPFRVVVAGTAPIKQLALVTNNDEEILLESNGVEIDVSGTLPPPPTGGWCYYYVRVIQEDNEMAWSSPIWMDALHTA